MKNKKLFLDFDEEEAIWVGLVKLKLELPFHELFFKINQHNIFNFSRKKDLLAEDSFGYYSFPIFETFDETTQNTFRVMINRSCSFDRKEGQMEGLFDFVEDKYFLSRDIDLIVFSKESWEDFSVIKFPEEYVSSLHNSLLSFEDELYQTILNYEE